MKEELIGLAVATFFFGCILAIKKEKEKVKKVRGLYKKRKIIVN